ADYLGQRTDCLDVGATDQSGNPANFSNYGSWVDIAAPGVSILSTYHNSDDPVYDYIALMDGTSMSCPHVVGVAALLESYNSALTGPEKFNIICNNYKSYNQTKYVGAGIVDARACLDAVQGCDVTADFSGTPTSGCVPLTVNFTDLSTGPVISWDWDFGDGGGSALENPSHQYTTAGTYTVSLTVTSSICDDTETKVGYITVSDVPVADFSGTPTVGYAPLTVDFTDLSTGNPTTWSWNFGDGVGTSTEKNPNYVYNDTGIYTVTLLVSNVCGSDSKQRIDYITVQQAPENSMHVSAMTVTRTGNRWKQGVANVTIVNQNNTPLPGAVVYGYFNAPNTDTKSGTTGSTGVATILSDRTRTYPSDWCFTVTDVVLSGYTYNSSANVVTMACESGPVYKYIPDMIPSEFSLNNYPNPFNPNTTIEIYLPIASEWNINIYNIAGRKVAEFGGNSEAGVISINWDASQQASGIYFMKATAGIYSADRKMVLMK
ncbi:MAG: PKD domain-containing protein, partial [Candidatus Zixiibacteriota bacterium]